MGASSFWLLDRLLRLRNPVDGSSDVTSGCLPSAVHLLGETRGRLAQEESCVGGTAEEIQRDVEVGDYEESFAGGNAPKTLIYH